MMSQRSELRRQLRAQRRALSIEVRRQAAAALRRLAAGLPAFRNADRIGFFFPSDGEPDVLPLLERAVRLHKRCYLPVLNNLGANRLWFTSYKPGDRLVLNRFGIAEPGRGPRRRVPASSLDVVLVPLVAFDRRGNRLGMGSGFYDRTLAFRRRRRNWRHPVCLGIAYDFQCVEGIEAEDWDIPLDGCLTEKRFYRFSRA